MYILRQTNLLKFGLITIGIIKMALNKPFVRLIFDNNIAISSPRQSSIAKEPKP